MKMRSHHNRRLPPPPGLLALPLALAFLLPAGVSPAQQNAPSASPSAQPPTQPPPEANPQPPAPAQTPPTLPPAPPNPGAGAPSLTPPAQPMLDFYASNYTLDQATGNIVAQDVRVTYDGVTLTADRLEGNFRRELVFSGHARIETHGAVSNADAIHFFPRTRSYRLDNPRAVLEPDFLQNRVLDPVYVFGGELNGTRTGYANATNFIATTCIEPRPHYELRIGSAELFPYKRLILRHVGVVLFGQKLIVLPYLSVPLDRRLQRPRTNYLPEFGQNVDEGYYARFPYAFAEGTSAATFVRLDATQKRGFGYRFEQEYLAGKQESAFATPDYEYSTGTGGFSGGFGTTGANGAPASIYGYGTFGPRLPRLGTGLGPQNGGLFAMQGYFSEGFSRNFNASFRHQQGIGSNNRIAFQTELQRNSFYTFTNQTSQLTRLEFTHDDFTHGVNADLTLGLNTNDSAGFSTNQLTGNYRQSFEFGSGGSTRNSLSYNFDFNRYLTMASGENGASASSQRTARLDSQLEFRHVSREYAFEALANASTPIGEQTGASAFGTLEHLPEFLLSADSPNFKGGWLSRLPLHFDLGLGRYSEPISSILTDRVLMGLTLQETPILRGRTEMTVGGGFEQRLYGDGAAQYILRNTTRLRQRLGGRSGFDLSYQYQQPEGGTPFFFDTFSASHYLTAEGGYLDDPHFQLTARVGYDFLGISRDRPWQSLSTRMMWHPTPSFRLDSLATYDPNTGRFFALTNMLRLRGRSDFGLDLITRYDPQQGKFSQINALFDIPLGRSWRLAGLLRYNGFSGAFESQNYQLTKEWDCLEASLTYSDNPFSFRSERQIYFTLRIKAFPYFSTFARGPAGEAVGPGLGQLY